MLAAYDVFRRYSQRMSIDDLDRLMGSGLLDAESSAAATAQRLPALELRSLLGKLGALTRAPEQVRALASVAARMSAVLGLYRAYPDDPEHLQIWSRAVARIVGDPEPDIPDDH